LGSFSAYHQEFSTVQSQDGTSSILTLLGSGHPKNCMKLTSAECTVENSWWWAKKMPETWQN